MDKLFGVPMDTIMVVLLAMFVVVSAIVGVVALRNRVMLKLGLRNIPRRRAQTALIVMGLTLATIIITSAFGTGDTVSYSIRSSAIDQLGEIDETIRVVHNAAGDSADIGAIQYFPLGDFERLGKALQGYNAIEAMTPAIIESVPLVDVTSEQNKSRVSVFGLPANSPELFIPVDKDGRTVDLKSLGANEVYITEDLAKDLNASQGDVLNLFVAKKTTVLTVKAIVRKTGLPGIPSALVMPLDRSQSLFGKEGQINRILISNRGGAHEGANSSKEVTRKLRSLLADESVVAEIATVLAVPDLKSRLVDLGNRLEGSQKDKMIALVAEVEKGKVTDDFKSLIGDDNVTAQLKSIAKDLPDQHTGERLNTLLVSVSKLAVDDIKARNVDMAEQMGNAFTSIFVVFSLFSIAAGILLIFLIFVMLAAERKPEMGMARAIGTKRRHLIEMFAFEGFAYDLMAAAIGVLVGMAVGYIVVGVIASAFGQQAVQSGLELRRHFEIRSLVVAYCLGMLLTFITVTVSAWRVSRINIVAAIRDLPDVPRGRRSLRSDFMRPFQVIAGGFRNLFHLRMRRAMGDLLWNAPRAAVRFWWTLFKLGPLTILLGALLIAGGLQAEQAFPFSLGVTLASVGLGLSVRWALSPSRLRTETRDRIGYSMIGILIVVYFSLPLDTLTNLGFPEMQGGMEMYFLFGMMMVLGAVLTIVYNADVLIAVLTATLGRVGRFAPVVKTAVAYPMSYKFRTGLTIAMFALVIFTMIVMSVIINTMVAMYDDRDPMTGGYQVRGTVSFNNPVKDMTAAIAGSGRLNPAEFESIGSLAVLGIQVRQPEGGNPTWEGYPLRVVDESFLDGNGFKLATRAKGYETDRDVWRALKENPGLAIVDSMAVPPKSAEGMRIGTPTFKVSGVYQEDETMDPITVEARDPYAGRVIPLTIIGVTDARSFSIGVYTSQATMAKALPYELPLTTFFFRLRPGTNAAAVARELGSAFLQNGMEAKDMNEEIDQNLALNMALNNLLQAFMALGLLVGIAALGVISTRAVVERRQQIGVLRAIGFKRGMIQLSFLLESSFTALLGIILGLGLGLILSYNLLSFMAKTQQGVKFTLPWDQLLIIVAVSYGASLLTTFLPARQAAKIYPAQALRYE